MSEFPLGYERISPTTWIYLSSLLMIGLYFKFNRFWSVRNLDLFLLILLAPGVLLADYGTQKRSVAWQQYRAAQQDLQEDDAPLGSTSEADLEKEKAEIEKKLAPYEDRLSAARYTAYSGHLWLFCVGLLLVSRLLLDVTMVRRPLLQPNLSTGGLAFIGVSLFVFLTANVIVSEPRPHTPRPKNAHPPGLVLLTATPTFPTMKYPESVQTQERLGAARYSGGPVYAGILKAIVLLSQLGIVLGIVCIGYRHFNNMQTGIGVATLYLMLPYVAHMTGHVDHVLPGALIVWGMYFYRRPLTAGMLIGSAMAFIYYPLFLLPLWASFYWQRGLLRFLSGVGGALLLAIIALMIVSPSGEFLTNFRNMFGVIAPRFENLQGVWESPPGWSPYYRIPIMVTYFVSCGVFAMWPAQKNLGTLMSCSAAVMAGALFWHGFGGGLMLAWYAPLLLLTIFRPNLEDRVALSVLVDTKRRSVEKKNVNRAA